MIGREKVVGGCMNREGMIFERGCDSLREDGYISEEKEDTIVFQYRERKCIQPRELVGRQKCD